MSPKHEKQNETFMIVLKIPSLRSVKTDTDIKCLLNMKSRMKANYLCDCTRNSNTVAKVRRQTPEAEVRVVVRIRNLLRTKQRV